MKLVEKINAIKAKVDKSKQDIANVMREVGVPDVLDNQTYEWYANKIIRWRSGNAFVVKLEFTETQDNVDRTVVLPMRGLDFNYYNIKVTSEQYPELKLEQKKQVTAPASGFDFTCDWGDGNTLKWKDGDDPNLLYHTYKPGTYLLAIQGVYPYAENNYIWQSKYLYNQYEYLRHPLEGTQTDKDLLYNNINYGWIHGVTEVVSWGYTQFKSIKILFANCSKLEAIPILDNIKAFYDIEVAYATFYGCVKLTVIPYDNNLKKGLFDNCQKLRTTEMMFSNSGLTGTLPSRLFANCISLQSVATMFDHAKIIDVPLDIFDNCPNITKAQSFLYGASTFKGNPNIFKPCKKLQDLHNAFAYTNATGVLDSSNFPSTLIDATLAYANCKNITGFTEDAFQNVGSCQFNYSFESTGITNLPDMSNASLGKCSFIRAFAGTKLTSIDKNALSSFTINTAANSAFCNIPTLTSSMPDLPEGAKDSANYRGIFGNCYNMEDYKEIPIELGGSKVSDTKIGMIMLQDGTYVAPDDFKKDDNNKPVYFIFDEIPVNADNKFDATSKTIKRYGLLIDMKPDGFKWWNPISLVSTRQCTNHPDSNTYNGKDVTNELLKEMEDKGWSLDSCPVYKDVIQHRTDYNDPELSLPTIRELLTVVRNIGTILYSKRVLEQSGHKYINTAILQNALSCTTNANIPNQTFTGTNLYNFEARTIGIWWMLQAIGYIREWIVSK